jgi:hypothetical protein
VKGSEEMDYNGLGVICAGGIFPWLRRNGEHGSSTEMPEMRSRFYD